MTEVEIGVTKCDVDVGDEQRRFNRKLRRSDKVVLEHLEDALSFAELGRGPEERIASELAKALGAAEEDGRFEGFRQAEEEDVVRPARSRA